jgi:hypothetical protein
MTSQAMAHSCTSAQELSSSLTDAPPLSPLALLSLPSGSEKHDSRLGRSAGRLGSGPVVARFELDPHASVAPGRRRCRCSPGRLGRYVPLAIVALGALPLASCRLTPSYPPSARYCCPLGLLLVSRRAYAEVFSRDKPHFNIGTIGVGLPPLYFLGLSSGWASWLTYRNLRTPFLSLCSTSTTARRR